MLRAAWLLAWLLLALTARADDAAPSQREHALVATALFEVRAANGAATVYLYGTMHLGRGDFFPLPRRIEDAFARCQALAVESDVSDARAMEVLSGRGMYPPGETLEQHVSSELWQQVQGVAPSYGMPMQSVRHMRPWMLSMLLSIVEVMRLGYTPELGVDAYLIDKAKRSGRAVMALEGDEVVAILSALSDADNERLLRSSIQQLRDGRAARAAREVVEAWRSGDLTRITQLYADYALDDQDVARINTQLIEGRNSGFADKIAELLTGEQRYFVAIGAAHLAGPDGVQELLRKRGFEVSRVLPLQ